MNEPNFEDAKAAIKAAQDGVPETKYCDDCEQPIEGEAGLMLITISGSHRFVCNDCYRKSKGQSQGPNRAQRRAAKRRGRKR